MPAPKIASRRIFTFDGKDFNSRADVKAYIQEQDLRAEVSSKLEHIKANVPLTPSLTAVPAEELLSFALSLAVALRAKKKRGAGRRRKADAAGDTASAPKAPRAKRAAKAAGEKPARKSRGKAGAGIGMPPAPAV